MPEYSQFINRFPEVFLHHIWKYGKFDPTCLCTTNGIPIQLIKRGVINTDSGPDFSNACLKLGNQLWYGNIEIHIKSSDWNLHHHQYDPAYNNTILHVVWIHDKEVKRQDGTTLPTLTLEGKIPKSHFQNYQLLHQNLDFIPCQNLISAEKYSDYKIGMLHKAVAERLTAKSDKIYTIAKQHHFDWKQTLIWTIAKYFGFKVNNEPMEQLIASFPNNAIAKLNYDLFRIESLLFGQAGFLCSLSIENPYFLALKKEYTYLKKVFHLQPLNVTQWKFSRMRPANFPTLRIAQLASLIANQKNIFEIITEQDDFVHLYSALQIQVSEFWKSHYHFSAPSEFHSSKIGTGSINGILINAIIPFCYAYGNHKNIERLLSNSFIWLSQIQKEENKLIKKYTNLGFRNTNAYESQGILGLYDLYCKEKKCLDCMLGNHILE